MGSNKGYFFMNYGYADLNKDQYPIISKNLLPAHSEWYYQSNLYIYLLSLVKLNYQNILDVGCGKGGGVSIYKEYYNFNSITGIDSNSNYIKYCNKKLPEIKFINNDILNSPFNNNSFDIITGVQIVEYFNDNSDKLFSLFKEFKRILTSKGVLLLTIHQYNTKDFSLTKDIIENNGFYISKEIDISKNILYSLTIDLVRTKDKIYQEIIRRAYEDMLYSTYKAFVIKSYDI